MNNLLSDVRHALRGLRKNPGFALVIILTLALGIGANSAIFSVVNGVLLRPLPYGDPERLVFIWNQFPAAGEDEMPVSQSEILDWQDQAEVFEGVAGLTTGEQNVLWTLTENGETEKYEGAFTTANLFDVLGVNAALGRTFLPEEGQQGADPLIVLSDGFWRRRMGADPNIIGRALTIRGEERLVVGVMPPGFHTDLNVTSAGPVDFWINLPLNPEQNRQFRFLNTVARLKPTATLEQAQTQAEAVARGFKETYPDAYNGDPGYSVAIDPLHRRIVGDVRTPLLVLLGAVLAVLLIACTNVANLLLIGAESRQREIAVRTALGAGMSRVVQQFVVESLVLTAIGGAVGILVAYGGVELLRALNPGDIPRIEMVTIDLSVVGFTVLLTAATGAVVGFVPGLHAARSEINAVLREGGRGSTSSAGRNRVRRTLVVSQVALAVVLVVSAGLLVRSFRQMLNIPLGIQSENVLTMRFDFPSWQYPEIEQVAATHKQILERVQALPGVRSASLAHAEHPLRLNGRWYFNVVGRPEDPDVNRQLVGIRVVSPGHLETLQIPLLRGRFFDESDRLGSTRVVLINQAMARRRFANEDPIGTRIRLANLPDTTLIFEVVGVFGDVKNEGIMEEVRESILLPLANPAFATGWQRHMTLMVRTPADPTALAGTLRSAISNVDSKLTVYNVRTLDQVVSDSVAGPRFVTFLLGLFAGLALALAAIGIYGVISYSVAQRTQEIGVRMALGAEAGSVLKLVMRQGLLLAVVGIGVGTAAAAAATRALSSLLYEVSRTDPLTFGSVIVFLVVVAMLASYLPARKASRIDPMVALRNE